MILLIWCWNSSLILHCITQMSLHVSMCVLGRAGSPVKNYSALVFCFYPRFWVTNAFWSNSYPSPRAQFSFHSKYCLSGVCSCYHLHESEWNEVCFWCYCPVWALTGALCRLCWQKVPSSCPWLYHALDLFPLPPLLWSEGFSKLLPPSWGDRALGTRMLHWWWERGGF